MRVRTCSRGPSFCGWGRASTLNLSFRHVSSIFIHFSGVRLQDKPTAYDLIASHGNVEDLTFFASLIEDFERVISHHVQSAEYLLALEMLYVAASSSPAPCDPGIFAHGWTLLRLACATLSASESRFCFQQLSIGWLTLHPTWCRYCQPNLELYYRFAPTLMQHVPRETVEACIRRPELDPRQLIPAFIKCYQQHESWEQDSEARSQVGGLIIFRILCPSSLYSIVCNVPACSLTL